MAKAQKRTQVKNGTAEEVRAANELMKTLARVHSPRLPDNLTTLYHYTTATGLLGLVSSGHIRGTNFSFLNDSTELSYGVELSIGRLEATSKQHRDQTDDTSLFVGVMGEIWLRQQAAMADTYVACFTEARDDLGQWRGYGGTADRYSVGFDVDALSARGGHSFGPVVYSRSEQERLVDGYIEATLAVLRARKNASDALKMSAVKILCDWLLESIPFFKDGHFSSEREWRAVTTTNTLQRDELEPIS